MLIIHCGWGKKFFLWGERSFSAKNFRGRRKFVGGVTDHLFGAGAERMAASLSDLGFCYSDLSRKEKLKMRLPASGKYPIPSAPILGELPKACSAVADSFGEWYVETLPLGAADLLRLNGALLAGGPASKDGRFLAMGVIAALDLCYVMECFSFALSLLERGRFLPDVIASSDGARCESAWSPILIGEDASRFRALEHLAPGSLRARAGYGEDSPAFSLRLMLSGMMDCVIRHAWARRGAGGSGESRQRAARAIVKNAAPRESSARERRRRGKLVSALNPHELWIRSLGWLGETDGLSQSLASIYPEVRDWRGRYEWLEHAPFRMTVKLSEDGGAWSLAYSLARPGSPEAIPALVVWRGDSKSTSGAGAYMRRYFLLMLGRIGVAFGPVRASLEAESPEGCALSLAEAADFLQNRAADFVEMGIDVAYPAWWSGNSPEDLMIMGVPGVAGDFCGWRPAWRGTVLSDDETDDVMSGGCPLMRLRGEWAFIPRSRVSEIASRVESLPRRLSLVEAVRLAVRDQCIVGFSGIPEAERVYGAIRRGTPPEILGDPSGMTCELRAYQRRGYSWLVFLSGLGIGACLADDMGLGKTVQTLALVQKYREMGHGRPVLLICPTSVIENWRLEMLKFFPSMTFYVHHGHSRLKGSDFLGEAERSAMVLSSYSLLHRDGELYREADWLGVVLDEAQNIKNPDTRQARAARGIKSDWRIALTGTPIENHAGDLWSIMEFLMPGMLGSRRRFAEKYVKPMTGKLDAMAAESLRSAVGPLVTRRLKTDPEIAPDLPAKIQTSEYCLLKKEQVAMYSSVAAEFTRGLGGVSGIKRRGMVLAALTKMKQICDHPALLSRDGDIGCGRSSKLERLISLAAEMYESGGRALVFTQYVEMGEILKHQLQEHFGREVFFLHGGVARDGRDRMVRDFESGSGPRFFVLSLRAGGVGLNLTGANHVVMFDRWWNPAVESQAIDRAYRIGQKRNVHVHIFCCRGTLEERIDEMIAAKRRVADSVILESDDWITEMSDRDLRRLVSLSPEAAE